MITSVDILPGRYHDSVRLMQVSRDVSEVAGVDQALVAMATDLNRQLLDQMGFGHPTMAETGPDDLIIAIRAADEGTLSAARAAAEASLSGSASSASATLFSPPPPHTVASAGASVNANVALISVPGAHAFVEAMDALRHDMHVMVFSDNVSVDHEVRLKSEAADRDLLVMGPDCGTAIVGGVGLGFANAVDPGPVAMAGASGTGIQQLCSLLDAAGVGVRHALGTGSRDLSSAVGAASTLRALAALNADPTVEAIIVVSKPPDPGVAATVEAAVASCETPVVTVFLGGPTVTLEGAARETLDVLGRPFPDLPVWYPDKALSARSGRLTGLFSGGTLRDEARSIVAATLGSVAIEPDAPGHRMVDYGGDEFTVGRAHPMIDPTLRLDGLSAVRADPMTGAILLDVVLGYGAHPDPGAELSGEIEAATAAGVPVVVSLCGTRGDPQGLNRQAETLRGAGAEVYVSNAAAARRAAALTGEGT